MKMNLSIKNTNNFKDLLKWVSSDVTFIGLMLSILFQINN